MGREDGLRGSRRMAGVPLKTMGFQAAPGAPVPGRIQLGGAYFGGEAPMPTDPAGVPAVQRARAVPMSQEPAAPGLPASLAQASTAARAPGEGSGFGPLGLIVSALFLAGVVSYAMNGK